MKIKKFLIVFFICMIIPTQMVKAVPQSDIYIQGIYDISEKKPFSAQAKLIKPNTVTSLSIVDSQGNQKFYNRFDNDTELVNLGPINNADIIVIVGKGEIAITFNK